MTEQRCHGQNRATAWGKTKSASRDAQHRRCHPNKDPPPTTSACRSTRTAARVFGFCEGLGVATLCSVWGMPGSVESLCDSSVARGIASRVGSGKLKHLQISPLWTQDLVTSRRATLGRVPRRGRGGGRQVCVCVCVFCARPHHDAHGTRRPLESMHDFTSVSHAPLSEAFCCFLANREESRPARFCELPTHTVMYCAF